MAFKKFDPNHRPSIDPYELEDRRMLEKFAGQECRRGTVTVSLEMRPLTIGSTDCFVSASTPGRRFDLVFRGQRAKDYRETVHKDLSDRRQNLLDVPVEDLTEDLFADADTVQTDIIVEGYWHRRRFKDTKGQWYSALELHVAKFHFRPASDPDRFEERGRVPLAA